MIDLMRGTAIIKRKEFMKIKDIITPDPQCISPDTLLTEAAAEMKSLDIGILLVCEDSQLVGTLTDRDIIIRAVAEGYDPNTISVSRIMSRDLIYCFDEDEIATAARMMEKHQIRRLPVLNREMQLVGIVSLGDLVVRTGAENLAGRILERVSEPARQAA